MERSACDEQGQRAKSSHGRSPRYHWRRASARKTLYKRPPAAGVPGLVSRLRRLSQRRPRMRGAVHSSRTRRNRLGSR
jgi:hypothetical protein